jgi:hypothetical protein
MMTVSSHAALLFCFLNKVYFIYLRMYLMYMYLDHVTGRYGYPMTYVHL